jgi:mRNA interferase MazF
MTSRDEKFLKRGEVYWVNLDPTIGSEITKTRPAVIISNDIQNELSSRVIVMPITSNIDRILKFEVKVSLNNKPGKAMSDQIRTIDKLRIRERISSLTEAEIANIDAALKKVLSLE